MLDPIHQRKQVLKEITTYVGKQRRAIDDSLSVDRHYRLTFYWTPLKNED
jgi:hypothetical protein